VRTPTSHALRHLRARVDVERRGDGADAAKSAAGEHCKHQTQLSTPLPLELGQGSDFQRPSKSVADARETLLLAGLPPAERATREPR
jgi:hypothetical protein